MLTTEQVVHLIAEIHHHAEEPHLVRFACEVIIENLGYNATMAVTGQLWPNKWFDTPWPNAGDTFS